MKAIGIVGPKRRVGTTTLVTALADAIATETGSVTIIDRGPGNHATGRYGHRTDRTQIRFADTPSTTAMTLVDCPSADTPGCLDALNECDGLIIVTDTSKETLAELETLARLVQQTNAVALAIVLTCTRTERYEPFDTLPDEYEHPNLSQLFDNECAPTTNCVALDYAHIHAANNGRYLSELDPPRPNLCNAILTLNDELDVLREKAEQNLHRSPPDNTSRVGGVNKAHIAPRKPTPNIEEKPPATPSTVDNVATRRHEFRIDEPNAGHLDNANLDLAVVIKSALAEFGAAVLAQETISVPPIRGKRQRRTCTIDVATSQHFVDMSNTVGWTQAQLVNLLLRTYFEKHPIE